VVLRLRIRLCYRDKCVESVGVANSGFASRSPEIAIPEHLARALMGEGAAVTLVERILADGSRTALARTEEAIDLYAMAEDRVEGPVKAHAYLTRGRVVLLSDSALSALRIVIIDPFEGIWCFRDELGRRERRGL